jgi:hypothetical protein
MGWFDPKSDFRSNPELFSDRRIARNSAGYLPKRNGSASVTLAGRLQRTKAGWRNAVMCRSRFPLKDSRAVEFRAEFFNLLNNVNFANPVSNLNNATVDAVTGAVIDAGDFGRIISTSSNPRIIQWAVKFHF